MFQRNIVASCHGRITSWRWRQYVLWNIVSHQTTQLYKPEFRDMHVYFTFFLIKYWLLIHLDIMLSREMLCELCYCKMNTYFIPWPHFNGFFIVHVTASTNLYVSLRSALINVSNWKKLYSIRSEELPHVISVTLMRLPHPVVIIVGRHNFFRFFTSRTL